MKKSLLILVALTLTVSQSAQAESAESKETAFFCLLAKVDGSGARKGDFSSLNFLLTGHPEDAPLPEPVLTYDPAGLLKTKQFTLFLAGPTSSPGYMVLTGTTSDKDALLLSLTPAPAGNGKYQAALGGRGTKPELLGQCFGPVGPMTQAEFLEDSSRDAK